MTKKIVIIPTYNELENAEEIIRAVFSLHQTFDVLIVDDNSPDGTANVVKQLQAHEFRHNLHLLQRKEKNGLGTAYIDGFKWCLSQGYEYVFEMDADFSHNPMDLPRLFEALCEGADVAIGSRYKTGVNVVNWPMQRVMMSYYASSYVRFITGLSVRDTTAGFVGYKAAVLKHIALDEIKFRGYAFQIEMKFTAWKHGFTLEEVPIILRIEPRENPKSAKALFRKPFLE